MAEDKRTTQEQTAFANNLLSFGVNYRDPKHIDLPHIVKFSGGRSSGMMLLKLLEHGTLNPKRGDVVIFNNTSAEHPKTYEFVAKCKEVCETEYKVPFFIVEYCTYEDAYQGEYIRLPTFRLANGKPHSNDNPEGYRWRGEIFEELLSWNGVLPSIFQRTCTVALKLQTTQSFLKDWFQNKSRINRKGHYGVTSRINLAALYRRHQKYGGSVPAEIFLKKKRYALKQPHYRASQYWKHFSCAYSKFNHSDNYTKTDLLEYIGLVGLRSDEKLRVQKILIRASKFSSDTKGAKEHIYLPLHDNKLANEDISHFWENQAWKLETDSNLPLSNCTFCFLKGIANLRLINEYFYNNKVQYEANTPCDINWWSRIESEYAKNFLAEGKTTRTQVPDNLIGFFGAQSGYLYRYISSDLHDCDFDRDYPTGFIPCECTE